MLLLSCTCQEITSKRHQLIMDAHQWCNKTCGQADPPPCLFGDYHEWIPRGTFNKEDSMATKRQRIDAAPLIPGARCFTHGRICNGRIADINVSGLPCVDYSPSGLKRGCEGPTNSVYIIFFKKHKKRKSRVIVGENVPVDTTNFHVILRGVSSGFAFSIFGGLGFVAHLACLRYFISNHSGLKQT